jgi:hypothetical protein
VITPTTHPARSIRRTAAAMRQRGVAAIEFALVFSVLFVVMYGIATFGSVLYIQQAVSRAAEDGARAIPMLASSPTFGVAQQNLIKGVVYDSLASALIVPGSEAGNPRTWIADKVTVTPVTTGSGIGKTGVVTVTYPYSANRLLPSIPLFDISRWMPDRLTGRATVAL